MRAYLKIKFNGELVLPIQYNYVIQAVILKWIGEESYQKFIHDTGYEFNKRQFKLYSFSRLEGKFHIDREKKEIIFYDDLRLLLTSADNKFLEYLINNVIKSSKISILNQEVWIDEINCSNRRISGEEKVYTKSPVVVYSTLTGGDKKKTYYYNPVEKEFTELVRKNLLNKYSAAFGKEPEDDDFRIIPLDASRLKESVVLYKGTVIKGYSGEFLIKGSSELTNLAYDAGIGSKNSQGFGCIELCR